MQIIIFLSSSPHNILASTENRIAWYIIIENPSIVNNQQVIPQGEYAQHNNDQTHFRRLRACQERVITDETTHLTMNHI